MAASVSKIGVEWYCFQIIKQRDDLTGNTEYVLNPVDDDFNQLQVETADGNDGDAMLRLGSQAVRS